jgi:hypothetical protein
MQVLKMTNHRIIATPAQIAAAQSKKLWMLLFPLDPKPQLAGLIPSEQYWRWIPRDGVIATWWDNWYSDLDKLLPYELGDRIFLAEPWYPVTNQSTGKIVEYWTDSRFESSTKAAFDKTLPDWVEPLEGNEAGNMPPEAAQHWLSIEKVQVIQMTDIDRSLRAKAALPATFSQFASQWNATFPEFPCLGDRWVITLNVASIATPELAVQNLN